MQEVAPVPEYFPAKHGVHSFTDVAAVKDENLPATHSVQVASEVALVAPEYLPFVHAMHVLSDVAPDVSDHFPAPHSVQTFTDVAAVKDEYLPVSHSVQAAEEIEPVLELYFPASQSLHVASDDAPDVSDHFPALQSWQTVSEIAAEVVEYFPVPQSVQLSEPAFILNFPATHAWHDSQLPKNPGLHAQDWAAIGLSELLGQFLHDVPPKKFKYVPATQFWQTVAEDAAGVFENLPKSHNSHAADPGCVLNRPAGHAEQEPETEASPSAPV